MNGGHSDKGQEFDLVKREIESSYGDSILHWTEDKVFFKLTIKFYTIL